MKSVLPRNNMSPQTEGSLVLRLVHAERDKRITSHLGLTARAFGADEVILAGEEDESALETWRSVSERFEDLNADTKLIRCHSSIRQGCWRRQTG